MNAMRKSLLGALTAMTLAVTGCAEGKYPVSGETCGPQDPVQTLDAGDCAVPSGV